MQWGYGYSRSYYTDPTTGSVFSALEVASRYFRAGADKVNIGSESVYAAEAFVELSPPGEVVVETAADGTTGLIEVGRFKPVVLVLMSGSAVAVPWAAEQVDAIVQTWYPGQAGGQAIADSPLRRRPQRKYLNIQIPNTMVS